MAKNTLWAWLWIVVLAAIMFVAFWPKRHGLPGAVVHEQCDEGQCLHFEKGRYLCAACVEPAKEKP